MIRRFAMLLTLAGIFTASRTEAQYVIRRGYIPAAPYGTTSPSGYYSTPVVTSQPFSSTTYSSYYAGPGATSQPTRTYSYSYYTLSPLPPRTYVGYGTADFPFHGSPYGHPYDPWTWPMMSGSYGNGLARYYDPPVK